MRTMSSEELRALWKELRERNVLSIYISAEEHDPAKRSAWRLRLQQGLDGLRSGESERPAGLDELEAARGQIDRAVAQYPGFLPGPGWAGFATADRLWEAGPVPAPVPDHFRWGRGAALAPYVRALKQSRVVAIALVDSRRARVFRYTGGDLDETIDLRVAAALGDLGDTSTSKRAATRSGVRGETARDAARRILEVELDRLVDEVADAVAPITGPDGLVVLGGPAEAVSAARQVLARRFGNRLLYDASLHLAMSAAEVRAAAARDASELSRRLELELVEAVLEAAGAGHLGRLGRAGVNHALQMGQADMLLLSVRFLDEHHAMADELVGAALDADADVMTVRGPAGDRLDEAAGGVAARLRYAVTPV